MLLTNTEGLDNSLVRYESFQQEVKEKPNTYYMNCRNILINLILFSMQSPDKVRDFLVRGRLSLTFLW